MKTNRIKLPAAELTTREDAELAMNELSRLVAAQRKVTSDRDAAVAEIDKRVAPELSAITEQIQARTEGLRAWAITNPDQFPKGRKSIEMLSGVLGFRLGTPKVGLISRAFTWEKVLGLLESVSVWRNFVRIKREVDKEALLACHANAPDKAEWEAEARRFGVRITQEETFYADPKGTEVEARQTVPG